MDATAAFATLTAFLLVFVFIAQYSGRFRQDERTGLDKDVEYIQQRTISDILIPLVQDVFEYEPLAYGEQENELADRLGSRFESGLKRIAVAYKCQHVARQFGRLLSWGSVGGIVLELVLIALVASLGSCIALFAGGLGASFFAFGLCVSFWLIRSRNVQELEDLKGRI